MAITKSPRVPGKNVIDVLDILSEDDWPSPPVDEETDNAADQVKDEVVDLLYQGPSGQHPPSGQHKRVRHEVEQLQGAKYEDQNHCG